MLNSSTKQSHVSRIKDRNTCNAKHIPNISLVTELEARLQKTCFLEAYFTVTSGKRSECTLPLFNVLIKRRWRGRRILLLGFNIQIHPRIISILLAHHCVIWQVTVGGQFFFKQVTTNIFSLSLYRATQSFVYSALLTKTLCIFKV